MSRFRISTQAVQNIEDIWRYLAQNNLKAADKLFNIFFVRKLSKAGQIPQNGQATR
jgi:toxin ParE1/3/4